MSVTVGSSPISPVESRLLREAIDDKVFQADIADPPESAGILSDGSFPLNAKRELALGTTGQDPDKELPRFSPVMGQTLFQPPQDVMYEYASVVSPVAPLVSSTSQIMPLVSIRTFSSNSPVDMGIFKPTRVGNGPIWQFRYIGDFPIHAILHGSLALLIRVGTDDTVRLRINLHLNSTGDGLPSIEVGEGGPPGRQALAVALASLNAAPAALIASEFRDVTIGGLNATDGLWYRAHLHVCQDVVFYPGCEYYFTVQPINQVGTMDRQTWGIRYESGGLCMSHDVSSAVKRRVLALGEV